MAAEGETDGEMPQRAEASIERLTSSIVIVVLYDFFVLQDRILLFLCCFPFDKLGIIFN